PVLFPLEIYQLLCLQIVVFPMPDVDVSMFKFHQCGVFHPWYRCDAKEKFLAILAEPDIPFTAYVPSLRHTVSGTGCDDDCTVLPRHIIIKIVRFLKRFLGTLIGGESQLRTCVVEGDVFIRTLTAADVLRLPRSEIIII